MHIPSNIWNAIQNPSRRYLGQKIASLFSTEKELDIFGDMGRKSTPSDWDDLQPRLEQLARAVHFRYGSAAFGWAVHRATTDDLDAEVVFILDVPDAGAELRKLSDMAYGVERFGKQFILVRAVDRAEWDGGCDPHIAEVKKNGELRLFADP